MNKVSVNISMSASGKGLREDLVKAASNRGVTLSKLVATVYRYAVKNRTKYSKPLKDSRPKPGNHISASVSIKTREALTRWANNNGMHRTNLCCFILEKTLEDDLLNAAFEAALKRRLSMRDAHLDDPDDD